MTMTNRVIDFLTTQLKQAKDAYTTVKNASDGGTLTSDILVKEGAKFWLGTLERVWGFLPLVEGTPIVYGTVGSGAVSYDSDPLSIQALPAGTVLQTTLILARAAGAVTGNPSFPVQPDGTYKFSITTLAKLTKDDLLLVPAFYTPAGTQQVTVAMLVLLVTP